MKIEYTLFNYQHRRIKKNCGSYRKTDTVPLYTYVLSVNKFPEG